MGRRPEAIDEQGHVARAQIPCVFEDRVDQNLRYLVRRLERRPLDPRLAVDAHADLHLTVGQLERRPARARDLAGGQRYAHAAGGLASLQPDPLDLVQRHAPLRGRTGALEHHDVAGDASPFA